ncbi:MAG: hypothetical protein MUE33_08380 [Cytophagaceae bacterium]|jgi:antitoxin component YwqK of YwqJK toxin-antitoxin module|nr:hypothetical protein [Cytophagaceae bacterium]
MKKNILLSLSLCLLLTSVFAQDDKEVKKYRIKTRTVISTEWDEEGDMKEKKKVTIFDASGNLIEEQTYKEGKLDKKETYKYVNGNCVEHAIYLADGTLKKKETFKYDSFGKKIEEATYNSSGQLTSKSTTTYNAFGEKQSTILYDGKGAVVEKTLYTYDAKGLIKEKVVTDAQGKVIEKKVYTYTY